MKINNKIKPTKEIIQLIQASIVTVINNNQFVIPNSNNKISKTFYTNNYMNLIYELFKI